MRLPLRCFAVPAWLLLATTGTAQHVALPFTEDFVVDAAHWRDAPEQPLSFVASGGPDGSSYASGSFNVMGSADGDSVSMFKGEQEFGSSKNAFVGDWAGSNVTQFSAFVRHDAPAPLPFFLRLAPGFFNFPGAFGFGPTVAPNTWTEVVFPINPSSLFFFEAGNFDSVMDNIGNIQLGFDVPASLAGQDVNLTLDIDQVSILPEPTCSLQFTLASTWNLWGLRFRGRRMCSADRRPKNP